MPTSAKAVANYFLDLAAESGKKLDPMKIQKLVYFAHGWHLALRDQALIDEQVEAWSYGPVVRTVYFAFREYGSKPITEKAETVTVENKRICFRIPEVHEADAKAVIGRVWNVYKDYSGIQLSNLTHEPGTPWARVYEQYGGKLPKGTDIPMEWIKEYFVARARR